MCATTAVRARSHACLPRRGPPAEAKLEELQAQPGFATAVLHMVGASGASEHVRTAAATAFKGYVKKNWAPVRGCVVVVVVCLCVVCLCE